jgi:hypothetical protein
MKKTLAAIALGLSAFAFVAPAQADVTAQASVTLNNDANFLGNAEGLAGTGCKKLGTTNNKASSVSASGKVTLFDGNNCTGRQLTVNGDIANLKGRNFDNIASSVRLG